MKKIEQFFSAFPPVLLAYCLAFIATDVLPEDSRNRIIFFMLTFVFLRVDKLCRTVEEDFDED